jgi:hypothetical protein
VSRVYIAGSRLTVSLPVRRKLLLGNSELPDAPVGCTVESRKSTCGVEAGFFAVKVATLRSGFGVTRLKNQ